jgi:ethanolaminephosphotransferase
MPVGLTMTFVFGRMTTKIILVYLRDKLFANFQAHLTKQPFPYFTSLILPLISLAIVINIPVLTKTYVFKSTPSNGSNPIVSPLVESLCLWGYLVLACVVYFRWAFVVIERICTFLDINCLTIKTKRQT